MALKEAGISLNLENEAQYKAGLASIANSTRRLSAETKLAVASLGHGAKRSETYRARLKGLGAQMDYSSQTTKAYENTLKRLPEAQKRIKEAENKLTQEWKEKQKEVRNLEKSYSELGRQQGWTAEQTLEAKHKLEDARAEYKNMGDEIDRLNKMHSRNAQLFKEMPTLLAESKLATAEYRNEMAKLYEDYRKAGGRFIDTADRFKQIGSTFTNVGNEVANVGQKWTRTVTTPLALGFGGAVKQVMSFNSEIEALGPLMAEGGEITSKMRGEVEQLGQASRKYAIEYAKSTSEINAGMAEFVRTGFNAQETMKMMPHILDASIASGEDFNSVMNAGVEGLMQFGLRTGDVNKNMQRVVDSYTHVANATKSGITDIGQAMSYVGSTAHGLGFTLEETASIVGILTNRGIEASKAGTGLRAVLSNLANPTKATGEAMAQLGIDTEAFKRGALTMPDIIDAITNSTKDLTEEQRTALLLQAFGRIGANAMNALVAEGSENLKTLTNNAREATGVTARMAEQMRNTPEFKFKQSIAQLKDLGIEIGNHLLPYVEKAMVKFNQWAEAFKNLDKGTQATIIKMGLFAMAVGPVLSVLGNLLKVIGSVNTGWGKLVQLVGKLSTPKALPTESIDSMGKSLGKIPSLAGQAGGAASLFSNPWLVAGGLAVGAIAGIGYAIYQEATAPQRAHQEAVERTGGAYQKWFSEVTNGIGAVERLGQAGVNSAKEIEEAYKRVTDAIMESNQKAQELITEQTDGKETQRLSSGSGDPSHTKRKLNLGETNMLGIAKETDFIVEDIAIKMKEVQGVTQEAINGMVDDYQKYGTVVEQVVGGSIAWKEKNMKVTPEFADAQISAVENMAVETVARFREMEQAEISQAQKSLENGTITDKEYDRRVKKIQEYTQKQIDATVHAQGQINQIIAKASREQRKFSSEEIGTITKHMMTMAEATGRSLTGIDEAGRIMGRNLSALAQGPMLEFLTQMGLISPETAQAIAGMENMEERSKALQKVLEDLGFVVIEPEVNVLGMDDLENLVELFGGDFASLTDEQKEALVNANGAKELSDLLYEWGIWKKDSPIEAKQAVIETDGALMTMQPLLEQIGLWNDTEFLSKFVDFDTNAPDVQQRLLDLINEHLVAQGLPPIDLETLTNALGTEEELRSAINTAKELGLQKPNVTTSTDVQENVTDPVVNAQGEVSTLDSMTANPQAYLNDQASGAINNVMNEMARLNGMVSTTYIQTIDLGGRVRARASYGHSYATGGHIDRYAEGGAIKWGGLFASGGKVPTNYMGIVGEAGPELFHVTDTGVSITPLSAGEKMRGIEGAIADYIKNKGGESNGVNVSVNLSNITIRDDRDIDTLASEIGRKIAERTQIENMMRKGRAVGHA